MQWTMDATRECEDTPMIHIWVGGLLVDEDENPRILLGHRAPSRAFYPNVWDMPGGHCAEGEAPEATLVRELQEEIGVTPRAWRQLGVVEAADQIGEGVRIHVFIVTQWSGSPVNLAPDEHDTLAWFTLDAACRLRLAHPQYRGWFQRLRVTDTSDPGREPFTSRSGNQEHGCGKEA